MKLETLEEFIARGGQVKKLPRGESKWDYKANSKERASAFMPVSSKAIVRKSAVNTEKTNDERPPL